MGLDMYLYREIDQPGFSNGDIEEVSFDCFSKNDLTVNRKEISSFRMKVCYWRKANAIHNWFVQNVQNGVDNCETFSVSEDKLIELYDECSKAYLTKNPKKFQPSAGFFFGNTEIDEYYWDHIFNTMKMLEPTVKELKKPWGERNMLNKASVFYYTSSW